MKKITLTIIGQHDKYDYWSRVFCEGQNLTAAREESIHNMRYGCQRDFTSPQTIQDGYSCGWGVIPAVMLESEEDIDDIPEGFITDAYGYIPDHNEIEEIESEGKRYAIACNWEEALTWLTSEELRKEEMRWFYDE